VGSPVTAFWVSLIWYLWSGVAMVDGCRICTLHWTEPEMNYILWATIHTHQNTVEACRGQKNEAAGSSNLNIADYHITCSVQIGASRVWNTQLAWLSLYILCYDQCHFTWPIVQSASSWCNISLFISIVLCKIISHHSFFVWRHMPIYRYASFPL